MASPTSVVHRPLRCSDALAQAFPLASHWTRWLTLRMVVLAEALKSYIRRLAPDGSIEREFNSALFNKLLEKFRNIWPIIDPISNVTKRLYYEFQIVGYSNEFQWLNHWLNNRPSMTKEHRRVRVSTGNKKVLAGTGGLPNESTEVRAIRKDLGYKGLPHAGSSQWFTYKGGLFRTQARVPERARPSRPMSGPNGQPLPPPDYDDDDEKDFYVRLYATTRAPFLFLLAEAKKKYEAANPAVIEITHFGGHGWTGWSTRQKRSFEDVILTSENRAKLQHLVNDFLRSGGWYLNRGLSWKKGILLHGPPGCGKTSTIVGLASKYDLKVYHLSLNHPLLTDESLAAAIRHVQQRSIVCLEDCDVWAKAHNRRLAETASGAAGVSLPQESACLAPPSTPPPPPVPPKWTRQDLPPGSVVFPPPPPPPPESRLSLAGLLNVLDGVDEQKGILYIMTSNDPSSLDSAMTRPGRVDATIELGRATRQQAEDLFKTFYKPYDEEQPEYDLTMVASWAKTFARCVDHCEFSPASLQGFLLDHRLDPAAAVAAMPEWVREKRFPELFVTQPPPETQAVTPREEAPTGLSGPEGATSIGSHSDPLSSAKDLPSEAKHVH